MSRQVVAANRGRWQAARPRLAWAGAVVGASGHDGLVAFDPRGHQEGHDGGVDVGELAHDVDDAVGGLVVEDRRQRLAVGAAREQHAHLGLAVGQLGGQLQGGPAEPAVGALDDLERQAGQPEVAPPLA